MQVACFRPRDIGMPHAMGWARKTVKPTIFLALGMIVCALPQAHSQSQAVRVAQVNGVATMSASSGKTVTLKSNDKVQPGDAISTDAGSSVLLKLNDGSTVEIYPATRVVFQDAQHSVWKNFLEVLLGTVKIHIEKLSGRPNPKSVTTPTAIIAVRGTIFGVKVDQEATTQVGVEEGLVTVASTEVTGLEVMVRPGFQTFVQRGQAPAQPQPNAAPVAPAGRFGQGSNSSGPNRTGPNNAQQNRGVGAAGANMPAGSGSPGASGPGAFSMPSPPKPPTVTSPTGSVTSPPRGRGGN
jgi:hypothetical protein